MRNTRSPRGPAARSLDLPIALLIATLVAAGWSRDLAARVVAPRGPSIMSACTLLTTDEVKAVLGYPAVIARRSPDSVREASRGESRCVFRAPPGTGKLEVVTVYVERGIAKMDQAGLNKYATTMALGDTARTLTGLGVTAAELRDPPTVVALKGAYLVLVSAPSPEGAKSLAAKAIARLP